MALEPGGYADKLGNRYEGRWVVRQLLRVLNEDLRSVTCEAVGDDERGVDLWIERPDGGRQAQQCKIRNVSKDSWTIAGLARRGILAAMKQHLDSEPSNEFALVTAVPSTLLHDICESARNSTGDPEEFYKHQVQAVGEDRRKGFKQFCERLDLDRNSQDDRARAFSYLQRLFIELWPDTGASREDLVGQAGMLVRVDSDGDPSAVVAVLADFVQDNLRKKLDGPAIWHHLRLQGFHPRRLAHDTRVLPAVQGLQARFAKSISDDLIAGKLICREETQKVLESIKESSVIALHGGHGQGKSGVLYELTEKFKENDIAYLPVRLDRQEPKNTPRQFGADLELPESPVLCLEAMAGDRPAVLILDQLDAIRWTSRHSLGALEVCKALVREVRSFRTCGKQISVVLACRTYDLQNDPEIKNWLQAEKNRADRLVEIPVGPLSTEAVTSVVKSLLHNANQLSKRQLNILQSPQHLAMWVPIVHERGAFEFQNRVQLMREYWAGRMREMRNRGISEPDANRVLTSLVEYMEHNRCITAPRTLVGDTTVLDALCGCGLIRTDDGQVTFSHQSYLDYQIASRVVREIHAGNRDVCEWLGSRDQQSLFRREQLRQALCLLSEESPDRFLDTIKVVLASGDIRFHLKHVCLEVTGQLDAPTEDLLAYLKELVGTDQWKEHILGTVFIGHAPFVRVLIESGTIAKWLETDEWQNSALWLLRTVREAMSDEVAATLRPYATRDDEWGLRVLGCLSWNAEDDSDAMFELRLELARRGVFQDFVNWEKLNARRALRLLESVVSCWKPEDLSEDCFRQARSRRSRFETWTDRDMKALLRGVREMPEQAWTLLVPHVSRLAPQGDEQAGALELWQDGDRHGIRQGMESVPHGLVRLVIESGKCLARQNGPVFWEETETLRSHNSPVVQYLLVETYADLPGDMADQAIHWLMEDGARLNVGTGENEPEWNPAARLVEALSPHCSIDLFRRLEETIVHYHSPNERRDAEYWLSTWKRGFYGDYWGRAQHFLLPSLCAERCSDETIGLIGVLQRKYAGYSEDRFTRGSRIRGGFVGSTLPSESLERISDRRWLELVQSKDIPESGGQLRHWKDDHCEESSVEMFSREMRRIAKRFPERFGRLALQFPDDVHPSYIAAVLEGLGQTEPKDVPDDEKSTWQPAPTELVEKVMAKSSDDPSREYALTFCRLLRGRAEERWSDAALRQLMEYACNHAHPKEAELCVGNADGGFNAADASVANLETNSLNCVRGVAALAIGQQLWNHSDLLDQFKPTIAHLCRDPHPAVRTAAVEACLPILNLDKDFAITCFCQAGTVDLRVAASRAATDFFNCGMKSHHDKLAPLVKQMLGAPQADVVQQGASEVAARWLFHDYFTEELERCLHGTVPQRKGLAQIAADFAVKPEYFDKCRTIIEKLKDDPEGDVRQLLLPLVRTIGILQFPEGVTFVQSFVDSQAFRDDPTALIHGLEEYSGSLLPFSDVLFSMCDQFVGPLRDASRDVSQGIIHDLSQFVPMLIRLYEQAEEGKQTQIVNRCLEAWDVMFEQRVGVVYELAQAMG